MAGRTVLIMGPPGAGKGTQATHLIEQYELRHVATGEVLREAVANGTELGNLAKGYMDSGRLVPDDVIIGVLGDLLGTLDINAGVLLDGFPRTRAQAVSLQQTMAEKGRGVDVAIDIRVPTDVLVERLAGRWICRDCQRPYNVNSSPPAKEGICDACGGELYQRDDDSAEAVRKRLEVYDEQTAPVASYYEQLGVLCVVDGNLPPDQVQASIDAAFTR